MLRAKSWVERVRGSGPMIKISNLSFRKFLCIRVSMSFRQVVRVEWEVTVRVLEER